MKRTWPVLLGLLLLASPAAQAQFNYYTNKGAVILTGYEPTDTLLEASAVVISNFVTIIEMGALEGLDMTRVTIPGSVTNIGAEAFAGDALLSAVFFSGNAPTFGANVFLDCGVFVSGGVTLYYVPGTTGWGTPYDGLTELLWDTQDQLGYSTNNNTVTITSYTGSGGAVILPSTINGLPVTSIGDFAFYEFSGLTGVTIPGSVTNIGYAAFDQCHGLTNITIPGSVTSIGEDAFCFCTRLTNATIANGVTSIGEWAFHGSSLSSLTIPGSVTNIGEEAFGVCSNLATAIIGNGVTSVGDYAFHQCTSLTGVYFTGNAPSLGSSVFGTDNKLTVYCLPGTTGWDVFAANTGLTPVLWNPGIPADDGVFGVQTNYFGFNVTNAANLTVVVEACTNLACPVWVPLATNTLSNGSFYFSEPVQANGPGRFYGLGVP